MTLSSDKKVLISCDREAKKFEIPDSVTTIDDGAFAFCIDLKSVKCPSSLTAIGGQAFAYSGITSFYIGEHVSSIGDGAFANCYDLEKIRVSPKNKYYRSIEGVLFNKANTVLIYYPQGKEDPFYKIPPPVTQLFPAAFLDCRNLKALHINEKLQDIATYNFLDCYDLQRITVDEKNTCFSLRDDVLFDCNQMILLLYPRDKEDRTYTVPEGVQDIHVGSFNYNFFLTSITLPDSVIALGPMCFCKCSGNAAQIATVSM